MEKYNLSPDTLVKPGEDVPEDSVYIIPEVNHRFKRRPDGLYKTALATLIHERSSIKALLKKASPKSIHYKILKERERALKVITNACYGYAGWTGARWYVREVAESAAALGRQLIAETIAKATALGLEVIYSDTDSIFVSNVKQKVKELIDWVKDPEMEIRVEREYKRVLFTEAMKRYAGLNPDGTLDIVGLEVVRGDWSGIARSVQENVLQAILKHESTKMAIEGVHETVRRLRNHDIPLKSFIIWKTLTKPIEKYRVRTPHAEVARKLAAEGWHVTVGDKVAYVIVKGKGPLYQRAIPYHEVRTEDLDVEYYVENQVKPAAMRILEGLGVTGSQLGV
jgi:DNA polymerase I